jgi:hypothetical protein
MGVIEKGLADAEEFRFRRDPMDLVEERGGRGEPQSDIIHIFFHLLDVRDLSDLRRAHGLEKLANIR